MTIRNSNFYKITPGALILRTYGEVLSGAQMRVGIETSNAAHNVSDLKQSRGRQYGQSDYPQLMTCYDDCARRDQDSWHKNEDFETQ